MDNGSEDISSHVGADHEFLQERRAVRSHHASANDLARWLSYAIAENITHERTDTLLGLE